MDPLTALIYAVMANDREAIDRAIADVPDVNSRRAHEASAPLHYAADAHSVEGIRALLAAGAHVDLPDEYGNTALHHATYDRTDDDEAIRLLRAAGADPTGAKNRHPDAFDGQSVIAAYDDHGVVLNRTPTGLAGFRRPWADTYSPGDAGDWEHVFCELPHDLLIPVTLAWQIGRLPTGTDGDPVQLAVIKLDSLPKPFPVPDDPDYAEEGYTALGQPIRLSVSHIARAISNGQIADPETAAILYAIQHEIAHGI